MKTNFNDLKKRLKLEDTSTIDTGFSGRADYGEEDKALGREDELEMRGLEEGHGLSQKDVDVLDLLVRSGEDDYLSDDEVEILKFIIKSNILQDKRKDLSKGKVNENRYDLDDPNSPLSKLNDNDKDVAILNNMTKKYGKDVVLMWMSSGEYGGRKTTKSGIEYVSEDLDVGHQDNEPHMLKKELL